MEIHGAIQHAGHPEVVGDGPGRTGDAVVPGAPPSCRFPVGRSGRVRRRGDVRTLKRRERRAPTAPAYGARTSSNNCGMNGSGGG